MAYGTIKVDTITFTDAGVDKSITVSGLVQNPTFSGNLTVSGTISGNTIQGQTVSGATITGGAAAFTTVTGGVATITSGVFALGSASNPSISFSGDANSGLYSPGADQVAISTNGTGRLFVDASGRVGIGTVVPDSPLQVIGSTSAHFKRTDNGTSAILITGNDKQWSLGVHSDDYFRISREGVGERLRITSDGKLGLGTSSPTNYGAGINVLSINGSAGGVADFYYNGTRQGLIGTAASGEMVIDTAGVATPLILRTVGSERVRIDSSGRVGIGTASPGYALDVTGSIRATQNIYGTSTVQTPWLLNQAAQDLIIQNSNAAYSLLLRTSDTERARITSDGKLLVGTSTARANFFNSTVSPLIQQEGVSGSSRFASITYGSNTEDDPIFIFSKHRGASVGGTTIVNSGDGLGKISFQGSDGTEFVEGAAIRAEVDGTPGANDLPSRLVFSTTADGASSPTERMRIAQNGVITIQNGAVAVIGTLTDGATITPDFAADCNFTVTLGGSRTIANPTNITAGQSGSIFIVQDATGSRTLSWGSYWDFPGGTAPTLSTAANAVDRVDYIVRSSTSIHTVFTANYS